MKYPFILSLIVIIGILPGCTTTEYLDSPTPPGTISPQVNETEPTLEEVAASIPVRSTTLTKMKSPADYFGKIFIEKMDDNTIGE